MALCQELCREKVGSTIREYLKRTDRVKHTARLQHQKKERLKRRVQKQWRAFDKQKALVPHAILVSPRNNSDTCLTDTRANNNLLPLNRLVDAASHNSFEKSCNDEASESMFDFSLADAVVNDFCEDVLASVNFD